MNHLKSLVDEAVAHSGESWLEEPLAQFERAWLGGAPPPLAKFVPADLSPEQMQILARELVKLDMNFRLTARSGQAPLLSLERYAEQLPALLGPEGIPADLIAEDYAVRLRRHEAVSANVYVARYPQHGSTLRQLLPEIAQLHARESGAPELNQERNATPRSRFLLRRMLGAGGLARVYAAVDTTTNETVAVKLLKKEWWQHRVARQHLEMEAILLQSLQITGVAGYRGHGKLANAGEFLATELISGKDLHRTFATGRASPEQAIDICRQLRTILLAIHAQGVIHADLKPSNLILNQERRITLVDFGFAVRRESSSGWNLPRGGTAAFLPPELLHETPPVGPALDVYGFGGIFLWLLTGKTARDWQQGWRGRDISDNGLLRICQACLDPDPANRPYLRALDFVTSLASDGAPRRPGGSR